MPESSFLLFAPPRPPVVIDPKRDIVIGRSPQCDLPVDSKGASRCHAAIRTLGDRRLVRDLGSTNGTYVNGMRLTQERELSEGDRIEIGDVAVTYCRVEGTVPQAASPITDETVVIRRERPPSSTALRGDLKSFPAFAVLQVLELGAQTGCLTIEADAGDARLWLRDGSPIHAEHGGLDGFDAAIALTRTDAGRFHFEPYVVPERVTIEATVTHVLMEASRLADEETV